MRNPLSAVRPARSALLLTLTTTGLLATGTLLAAPPADGMRGHGLRAADTNNDKAVSAEEFDAMRAAHLARLDGNNDGFVTFEEHKAAREARAREHFLARHDVDGDGRISVDEMADRGGNHFERMDRNRDGAISGDELRRHHRGGSHARGGHGAAAEGGR